MDWGKLSNDGKLIVKNRYIFGEDEDWKKLSIRCGRNAARIEKQSLFYEEKFAEMIYNMDFLPGGRILRNIGRVKGSLFNCFALPINDSMKEIGQFIQNCLIVWSSGGGIGTNVSYLRPSGASVKGAGGVAAGPIKFLTCANSGAQCMDESGQRRAAGLALMLASHPDIIKFIDAKMIDGLLNCFNISIGITEDFIEAIEKNKDWNLTFNHKVYNTVNPRKIWDKIISNMVKYGEPGLINWNNLRSNNSYFFDQIIACNPCGEAPLGPNGICNLGSIVLTNFISNINTNWKKMEETLRLGVRFLDNIIDINNYILSEFEVSAHNGRRIGIGVMGLADYLFAKQIRYGSKKSIYEVEKLIKFIRDITYDESIKIATEKGAFPKFDPVEYGKAHFIRSLSASTRISIKKHGIRNVTLMAMAPTGTISLLPQVTSGIEPLFLKAYKTNDNAHDRIYVHPIYKEMLKETFGVSADWFVDTTDLKPADHLEVQVAVQKYTDGAVSKTINMKKGTTEEELSDLLLEYIHDLKGVTVYVDGSKNDQPLVPITDKNKILEYINKGKLIEADENSVTCATGNCKI